MPWSLKLNALAVLAMGAAFCRYFLYAKHDGGLAPIIPFANDPYDSVGSFAVITSVLLGGLVIFRAFRPYRKNAATEVQQRVLVRTLMAIVLAVLITLAANLVAMGRHPTLWIGQAGAVQLVTLTIGIAVFALVVGYITCHPMGGDLRTASTSRVRAAFTILVFVAVLSLFPENIISNTTGELVALATGIVLLFLPMSVLVVAVVPYSTSEIGAASPTFRFSWIRWGAVLLLGIAIGSFFLLLELREGGGVPLARLMIVAASFIGAGTMGLVTGYVSLKRPLDL